MDEINLVNIGYYLSENNIDIRCQDFEELCEECKAGDFVYFDSPYLPESETAYFTDYTKDGFNKEDHERLAKLFRLLDQKGVMAMLSNNNVPLAHQLYAGFKIDEVDARRAINSDAKKRVGKEVIITNYEI
jgi:DNA adenine methylase